MKADWPHLVVRALLLRRILEGGRQRRCPAGRWSSAEAAAASMPPEEPPSPSAPSVRQVAASYLRVLLLCRRPHRINQSPYLFASCGAIGGG